MYYSLFCVLILLSSGICAEFKLGLESITPEMVHLWYPKLLKKFRVGLVTNQTGKDQKGRRNVELLQQKGFTITLLLAPEHGFKGTTSAGKPVLESRDKKTGIPIMSLYQGDSKVKAINSSITKDIDLLLFDIQDSGMRHYTYISTLLYVLRFASEHNVPVIVLDRPNPLGGVTEGPLVEKTLESFISIAPIPLRHGMTIGEVACYFNDFILQKQAPLHIVVMQDFMRNQSYSIPLPLSPNIKSRTACLGYSFLGLLGEIEPFNVGVGTSYAFQCFLLPQHKGLNQKQWHELQVLLNALGLSTIRYTSYISKKKSTYTGLRLSSLDTIAKISSFQVFLSILAFCKKHGVKLGFSPMFNKAIGTCAVQEWFNNALSYVTLCKIINQEITAFIKQAQTIYMYKPCPKPFLLPCISALYAQ